VLSQIHSEEGGQVMELIEKFKEKKGNELRKKSLYVKSMIREKHKVSVLHDEFNTILSDTIDELYGCLPNREKTTGQFWNECIDVFEENLQKLIEEK
jgi:hypothetical protein